MYLLKLAIRPWRLAPWSQMFSGMAVGFLLLLIGFLFWIERGLKPVLARLEGEQVVTAYLDSTVSSKNETLVVDKIRIALGAESMTSVPEIKFVNSNQFIGLIKNKYPDLGRELEDLGQEMDLVVPRYVSISGMLPTSLLNKVKAISEIEYAESSKDRYRQTAGAFSALRWVVRALMLGIALSLLTGLIHLSRMNAFLQSDSLHLLKLWGADNKILLIPGLVSGLLVGLFGGGIALGGWITVGHWLTHHVRSLSVALKGMPLVTSQFQLALLFIGAFMGILAGVLGTLTSQVKELRVEGEGRV
jgi:cell division transport system permease protein